MDFDCPTNPARNPAFSVVGGEPFDIVGICQIPDFEQDRGRIGSLEDDKAGLASQDEKSAGKDEGEEDEGKLFEPDYLYKMIKVLRSSGKELNFGFGLNKQSPEASRLLLARKGKPEKLYRALKQTGQFSAKLLMCGHALPDPTNGKVLVFRLEEDANEPPQISETRRS